MKRGRASGTSSRFVGDVFREVIALFRLVRLLDVVIVLDQLRIPLVGFTDDEAVEAVVTEAEGPSLLGRAHIELK